MNQIYGIKIFRDLVVVLRTTTRSQRIWFMTYII